MVTVTLFPCPEGVTVSGEDCNNPEDVHVRGVADCAQSLGEALQADVLDGQRAHVHHQRIDQLYEDTYLRRVIMNCDDFGE